MRNNSDVAIVIPTIRSLSFLSKWRDEFVSCIGIIVEDHPTKQIKAPKNVFKKVYHYSWEDIDSELKKNSWIIPRKNAGIRSYGFIKAAELGCKIIITLDDDCYPIKKQSFVKTHINNLSLKDSEGWFSTYPHSKLYFTRGFPYLVRQKREVVISHGLWTNQIDLDAQTQLAIKKLDEPMINQHFRQFIPQHLFFPMCSMNLAFKTKIIPVMYFPPMGYTPTGKNWGFDRFDDIWAGICAKKILDHLNLGVSNGIPFVEHKKASNIQQNIMKERAGIKINEFFHKEISRVVLTKNNPHELYLELFEKVRFPSSSFNPPIYFRKLKEAVKIWINLLYEKKIVS